MWNIADAVEFARRHFPIFLLALTPLFPDIEYLRGTRADFGDIFRL